MLSTPLPHWLHHCPPPTYSPYPDSAELCVRHVSPVCPDAKKLQEETHSWVLSTSFLWFYQPRDVPFTCYCDLSSSHDACSQPHCSCYQCSQHRAPPGTSQRWRSWLDFFFFKYSHSSRLTIFYCRIDYYSPAKKHKDLDAGFLPSNIFAVLEQAVGTACSCQ